MCWNINTLVKKRLLPVVNIEDIPYNVCNKNLNNIHYYQNVLYGNVYDKCIDQLYMVTFYGQLTIGFGNNY